MLTLDIPRPTWADFRKQFASRWEQGEHVFVNGQTGSGKTELILDILELRSYVTFFVTKPRDPIFKSPGAKRYKRMREFKPTSVTHRIMLEAKSGDSTMSQVGNQQAVFAHALDTMYAQGGWTVGADETLWLSGRLGLSKPLGDVAYMGRALGVTGVFATQRPAHIPVIIAQSASHAFIGKTSRKGDLKTLAELGGDTRTTEAAIASLRDQHDFLYVDTQGILPMQIVNTRA